MWRWSWASTEPESLRDTLPPTDVLLGREMGFKTGPCFELRLWALLVMCESGETRGSLYTTCSGELRGERGAGGGLASGEATCGGRIRLANFGLKGSGRGSGADSALEWGLATSCVCCWYGSSLGVMGRRRLCTGWAGSCVA